MAGQLERDAGGVFDAYSAADATPGLGAFVATGAVGDGAARRRRRSSGFSPADQMLEEAAILSRVRAEGYHELPRLDERSSAAPQAAPAGPPAAADDAAHGAATAAVPEVAPAGPPAAADVAADGAASSVDAASSDLAVSAGRTPMHVLIGTDGSPAAERACSLAASLAWPEGSRARVVCAYDQVSRLAALPGMVVLPETIDALAAAARDGAREIVETAARRLERPGLTVETLAADGRPADVLIDAAASFRPDLLVVGHRGLGPFESALLGSVSAELVDRAPCPVLVVRTPGVSRILVADDGSEVASRAADVVRRWPALHGVPVLVLGVLEADPRWPGWLGSHDTRDLERADALAAAGRTGLEAHAHDIAERLRGAGIDAASRVVTGQPARCLVEVATDSGSDLIVVGSRGDTGAGNRLVGSVARSVLWHAPCSVLVVPSPDAAVRR